MEMATVSTAWDEIAGQFKNASLLLGNGFSISIDSRFEGNFLASTVLAQQDESGEPSKVGRLLSKLNETDIVKETNIESALASLAIARSVVDVVATGSDAIGEIERVEKELRSALLSAIRAVHPENAQVVDELCRRAPALCHYSAVFTTNFDLLLYWMVMAGGLSERSAERYQLIDFFWNDKLYFNPLDAAPFVGQIPVYYVHGALHLVRDAHNGTQKMQSDSGSLLMELMELPSNLSPLIVTAGDSREKAAAIRGSEYLYHCLETLEKSTEIVVLGHALAPVDDHLVRALVKNATRIAVGLHDCQEPPELAKRLCDGGFSGRVEYFDSSTHPLCGTGSAAAA